MSVPEIHDHSEKKPPHIPDEHASSDAHNKPPDIIPVTKPPDLHKSEELSEPTITSPPPPSVPPDPHKSTLGIKTIVKRILKHKSKKFTGKYRPALEQFVPNITKIVFVIGLPCSLFWTEFPHQPLIRKPQKLTLGGYPPPLQISTVPPVLGGGSCGRSQQ